MNNNRYLPADVFFALWRSQPTAIAFVEGSPQYPNISGTVCFYQAEEGVYVVPDIYGLPQGSGRCDLPIFAPHIHSGSSCTGTAADPFADADGHFNPNGCEHPFHAGDLPPLFGNAGHAWYAVLTNRFSATDVIGRTVIIHAHQDDFNSQPSGNSGAMIACGEILAVAVPLS